MVTTPKLGIRLMASNDVAKEVVFNEATVVFDTMVSRTAKSRTNTPPVSPANGDTYVVSTSPTGAWSGHANAIAVYFNGWRFYTPTQKMKFFLENVSQFWTYSSTSWSQDPAGTPSTLDDLTNVGGATPSDNDVLTYDSSTSQWLPQALPEPELDDIADVNIAGVVDGDTIAWNATAGEWQNVPLPEGGGGGATTLGGLTDVDMGDPETGGVLTWNGTTAQFLELPSAGVELSDLADVVVGTPVANDALVWNGATWAPSSLVFNYSFVGMVDGPMTFEGFANHFLVVDPTETMMEFRSLDDLIDVSDFQLQGLADVQAPADAHVNKFVQLKKTGADFHFEYSAQTDYSIPFWNGTTQLTARTLSLKFNGFAVTEPTEGNIVVTAQNALAFKDHGADIAGTVSAINFNGTGLVVEEDGGVVMVTVDQSVVGALSDLEDVDVVGTPPVDGAVLKYDGVSEKWVPGIGAAEIDGEAEPATYELGPLAPPTAGMFPLRTNAPSADMTFVANRGLVVQPGAQGSGVKHAVVSRTVANNEAPWVVTARIVSASFKVAGHACGIVLQRAFNNAFVFLALGNSSSDTQFNLRLGSVNASSVETAILSEPNMYNWLRLGFDGNYVRAWVSSDGLLWQDFGSPLDASTVLGGAPDRVGITNRSNAVHDGSVGGLVTYWEDPDFPATSRVGQGVVTLTMATLQDVDLLTSAPEDGQALVWDEVSETWVPGNAAGGGAETLDELTDVDVTTTPPTDGQVLRFDDATDTWKPGTVASGATMLDGLTDVDVSTTPPSDGQVLRFDDATDTWKPGTVSTGATNINALTDVDTATTAPTDGQALIWNNSAGQWKPGTVSSGGGLTINDQTDSYTLVLADAGKYVRMNVATANTLTVPPNSSVAFAIGTAIPVRQAGAGQVTVVAGSGVTVNTPATLKLRTQHSGATLIKVATDAWDLTGDLELA